MVGRVDCGVPEIGQAAGGALGDDNAQGQIWHQIEDDHSQLEVAHHGVVDFIKSLFGYLEPTGVNPERKIASEHNPQKPHHQEPHVDCQAPT
jgi:hypothetical protein